MIIWEDNSTITTDEREDKVICLVRESNRRLIAGLLVDALTIGGLFISMILLACLLGAK